MSKRISVGKRDEILLRLEGSGLSVAEFCRRRGLRYGTVMRWRREGRSAKDAPPGRAFVEVELDAVEVGQAGRREERFAAGESGDPAVMLCAQLALPGGAVLRIYGGGHGAGNGKSGSLV